MSKSNIENSSKINNDFITEVYEQMLAFAISQLKNKETAQDVVQDAIVSALQYSDKFKGQSTLKTWVFAILKNKIVDEFRKNDKYIAIDDMKSSGESAAESDDEFLQLLFDESGFWHSHAQPKAFDNSWTDPAIAVEGEGFFEVMEICLSNLPAEQARVFLMREYLELDTDEICKTVNITSSKFYVIMHRARLRLQQCLNIRWFEAL